MMTGGQILKKLPDFESKTTPVLRLRPGGSHKKQPKQSEFSPSHPPKETPHIQNTPLQSNCLFFSYKYTHSKFRPFSSTVPTLSWGQHGLKDHETPALNERVPAARRTHSSVQPASAETCSSPAPTESSAGVNLPCLGKFCSLKIPGLHS